MKQYKLINNKTKEKTICDKIIIDSFDYYIDKNNHGELNDYITDGTRIAQINILTINDPNKHLYFKIIATNNFNIDIPKVVNKVDSLYPKLDVSSREDTMNIYLREGFNKAKETYQFNEEDMIEFAKWLRKVDTQENSAQWCGYTDNDMLKYWKENHKIETIYFD